MHAAVDTLGRSIALSVTPASEQKRAQVNALCEQVQKATAYTVELVCTDQGCTGEQAKSDGAESGIGLQVVALPEADKGFALLPRRWVVE